MGRDYYYEKLEICEPYKKIQLMELSLLFCIGAGEYFLVRNAIVTDECMKGLRGALLSGSHDSDFYIDDGVFDKLFDERSVKDWLSEDVVYMLIDYASYLRNGDLRVGAARSALLTVEKAAIYLWDKKRFLSEDQATEFYLNLIFSDRRYNVHEESAKLFYSMYGNLR